LDSDTLMGVRHDHERGRNGVGNKAVTEPFVNDIDVGGPDYFEV
jgi:hypothetical protein